MGHLIAPIFSAAVDSCPSMRGGATHAVYIVRPEGGCRASTAGAQSPRVHCVICKCCWPSSGRRCPQPREGGEFYDSTQLAVKRGAFVIRQFNSADNSFSNELVMWFYYQIFVDVLHTHMKCTSFCSVFIKCLFRMYLWNEKIVWN